METRFYQTQEITIPTIAQALELEYKAGIIATCPSRPRYAR
jgi:hypothetical protein